MASRSYTVIIPLILVLTLMPFQGYSSFNAGETIHPATSENGPRTGAVPGRFTPNLGQYPDDTVLFMDNTGILMAGRDSILFMGTDGSIDLEYVFMDSDPDRIMGIGDTGSYSNFFYGNDPEKWLSGVPEYEGVLYEGIYPGIDLKLGILDGALKYDLILEPFSDPSDIRILVLNSRSLTSDGSCIEIETGTASFIDRDLMVFYDDGSGIDAKFRIIDDGTFGFQLNGWDRSRRATIDPLVYSTLVGGSSYDDQANDGKPSRDGGFVYTGYTFGGHPVAGTPYDGSHNGAMDCICVKLNPTGSNLVFSTYMGGSGTERGHSIFLDDQENIFITGYTSSADFPTTEGSYDPTYNGGEYDIFITKLSKDGKSLLYSTYVGGSERDQAEGITVDGSGNAIIAGNTLSTNYPTTIGAYDTTPNGGADYVVTKIDQTGGSLVFSTLVGGSSNDIGKDIEMGSDGHFYVFGTVESSDMPTSAASFDNSHNGNKDFFILKLNSAGSQIIHSTYVGGSMNDQVANDAGSPLELDAHDNVYLCGSALSSNFVTSLGCFDPTYGGDISGMLGDGVITELDPTLSRVIYSSYLGGSESDQIIGLDIDWKGRIYMTGRTDFGTGGNTFPLTEKAFDSSYNGNRDGFFTVLK
ncbi:MAG: SBBP repeat-containing protein [Thermoplasmatota archaeon]